MLVIFLKVGLPIFMYSMLALGRGYCCLVFLGQDILLLQFLSDFIQKCNSSHSLIQCRGGRSNVVLQHRFYVESHHAMITVVNSQPNKLVSHLIIHLNFLSNLNCCTCVGKGFRYDSKSILPIFFRCVLG